MGIIRTIGASCRAFLLIGLTMLFLAAPSAKASNQSCALALALAIDVSGSVDQAEYGLQMSGLAAALRSDEVANALATVGDGQVYISAMHWSGTGQQAEIAPWTLIRGRESINRFAALLEAQPRSFDKFSTAIGEALVFAEAQFAKLSVPCRRRVIDVSGDGRSNEGWSPNLIRDGLVGRGVTINALAILANDIELLSYFQRYIIGGAGSFVMSADHFVDYPLAIKRKLVREILPPVAKAGSSDINSVSLLR